MTILEPQLDPNLSPDQKRRFLPYPPHTLDAVLPLSVRSVEVDGLDVTADAIKAERCRIRPHVVPGWQRLRIEFLLQNIDDLVRAASYPDENDVPLRHLLRIRCRETRLRRAASIDAVGRDLVGVVTLSRDDVEKVVLVEAATVRADLATKPTPLRGNERFNWLARSPRWLIEVEEPRAPAGGAFDLAWVDFGDPKPEPPYRNEDAGHLVRCPDALSHVAIRPEGPLVLINRRFPAAAAVLSAKGTIGVTARLRDVLLSRIAVEAWRSILLEAIAAVGESNADDAGAGDWADLGDEHWTTPVLRHAAKAARCSRDDLISRLRDPSGRPGFLFEVSETLGRVGSEAFRKLVEEIQGA